MAEEPLVKEALTEQMISAGSELTRALDRAGWPLAGALWLFDPENNEWQLLLASTSVRGEGPRAAYARVAEALRSLNSPLPLESIAVVDPADTRIRLLASVYPSNLNVEGRRFSRSAIGGHVIDDAYIYRLHPVAPAA
jgi:hypothetical protein